MLCSMARPSRDKIWETVWMVVAREKLFLRGSNHGLEVLVKAERRG